MRHLGLLGTVLLFTFAIGMGTPALAEVVTMSGTIHYDGPYSGTLYVAAIDTTQADTAQFLGLQSYTPGSPPFDQPYSISFDNAAAPTDVIVAALLDVDGGGVDTVGQGDIIGWYNSQPVPTKVSTSSSHNGLHFDLPQAEVHGTVTFAPGQTGATVIIATSCTGEGAWGRPGVQMAESGTYSLKGIYAGTWCGFAFGFLPTPPFFTALCFGDPTCANPTPITLTTTEIRTGIDFDFSGNVRTHETTWGHLKSKY
jgi:hypothetical protein